MISAVRSLRLGGHAFRLTEPRFDLQAGRMFPLLLQAQFTISESSLHRNLLSGAIGVISVAVALTALTVFLLRKPRTDRTMLWFGIFAFLYGVRILVGDSLFLAGIGLPTRYAVPAVAAISYTIQIPGSLFALRLIDATRSRLGKVLLAASFGFAALGLASVLTGIGAARMPQLNNVLVIFFFLPAYIWAYYISGRSKGMRWMQVSFFVFIATVIIDNLSGMGFIRTLALEQFGYLLLLSAMGSVAARNTIASEQKLLAVERELEIAWTIQQSILPDKIPQLRGLEVAVRYVPMTAVAGDFYDFVELDRGRLGVLVADVSGHGVPAALIASMLKMAFSAHAADAADPAALLAKLNDALCGRFSSHFVTAAYVVLDPAAGTLTYSGAAHPPLLVRRASGAVDELSENGLMLGAFAFAKYANATTTICPGEQVLLYTDGLAEGSNPSDEEFGTERLKASFGESAANTIGSVFEKTAAWTGRAAQQDDLTAVAIGVS